MNMNRSQDWYKQAKRDFSKAELDCEHAYFEWCCFTCQQAAEKSVKALYLHLNMNVRGHSLTKLLGALKDQFDISEEIMDAARRIDRFYIESRYPNGFPEGSPYDFFSKSIAEQAINDCREIIGFVDNHLG